jgi:hypothetical protein
MAADGWSVGALPRNCSFCFCDRGNERVRITIEPGHRAGQGADALVAAPSDAPS